MDRVPDLCVIKLISDVTESNIDVIALNYKPIKKLSLEEIWLVVNKYNSIRGQPLLCVAHQSVSSVPCCLLVVQ